MTQSDGGLSEAEKLLSQAREALDARKAAHAAATESAQKLEDELSAHKAQIMERLSPHAERAHLAGAPERHAAAR